jgi:HAE1 family hydrophobic/amphiphilic exporter-1
VFLSNLSIKRPVFAAVLMLALVTLGLFSYKRLAIDMWPNVEIPYVTVITTYPGAAPETVEREVSKRIEEAVNPISGVKHVGSVSRESVSSVWIEFELGVDVAEAVQEARVKVAAIRDKLPDEIAEPIVDKIDFSSLPIVSLAVRSETLPPRELTDLAEKLVQRRVENVAGVGKVDLVGTSYREVAVEILPDRLLALGLGVDDVIKGLRAENVNVPVGRLDHGGAENSVRVSGKPKTVSEYEQLVVAEVGGRPIALGDVARIVDGVEEQRTLALVNGQNAVAVDVIKQSGANTVAVVEAVRKEIEGLERDLPQGTTVEVVRDGSVAIRESVRDVQETLIIGALLTILIVFCFLNSWRSTVITGLTLPIAVISSFIIMNFAGMSLNTMTLMALSLSIGLLIDDAIVVRENIVRHLERGSDHHKAARDGTAEIGLAVLATTMSIIAVFIPVAFMKGIVGRFFRDFGITVAFAVAVSLFVSFTLDPMLSSRWVDPDIARAGKRNPIARALDRFNEWFDRTADKYRALIAWALDHRKTIVVIAVLAFVGGMAIFGTLQSEFMPGYDQGEFRIGFLTAPDASLAETEGRLRAVITAVRDLPEVESTYATVGAGDDGTVRDGAVYVNLVDKGDRKHSQIEVERVVRERLAAIPGIKPSLTGVEMMNQKKPLQIGLRGEDLGMLKEYAARLKDELYGLPGFVDIESSLDTDTPEYRLVVDRDRAADVGLNSGDITSAVSALVGGQAVTNYEEEDGDAVPVRVRLPESLRSDVAQIDALRLSSDGGKGVSGLVPLGDLLRHEMATTPSQIDRQDLSRQVMVSASLDGVALGTAGKLVQEAVAKLDMAPGYRVVLTGDSEHMVESFGYMGEALLLAIIMVYLILAAQFESFIDPLSIMLSLPLAVVGMAAMLALTGDALSIIALIGLIMLMGLVTKNAILLIDYTKTLRERGLERREALIEAGRTRLRPIMMTTLAMIFGMLPTALAIGSGAEMRAPMGRAVIGGLITSTMLTLIVVPVVYSLLDDLASRRKRSKAASGGVAKHAAPGIVSALLAVVMVLAVLAPTTARAQATTGADTLRLTLTETTRLAAAQHRNVQSARAHQDWVHGKYVQERAGALPSIKLAGGLSRQRDESQTALFGGLFPPQQDVKYGEATLSQALFTWGQVGSAMHAAREGMSGAGDQVEGARQAAIVEATQAYGDLLLARELADLAARDVTLKQKHADEAQRRFDEGTATDYDVLAARVALQNVKPQAIRAANAVRTARDRLRFVLAVDRPVDAVGRLDSGDTTATFPDYATALATAYEHRPDLASMQHERAIRKDLVKIYNAGDKPRLDLHATAGQRAYNIDGLNADGPYWSAALAFSFPIFDGMRTRGQVAQARSDLHTLEIDEARLRDRVALEVRTALGAVEEARGIEAALAGTAEQARRLLQMAEDGYELGVTTFLDVEDAQLGLLQAETNLAGARRDRLVAEVTLQQVQGVMP